MDLPIRTGTSDTSPSCTNSNGLCVMKSPSTVVGHVSAKLYNSRTSAPQKKHTQEKRNHEPNTRITQVTSEQQLSAPRMEPVSDTQVCHPPLYTQFLSQEHHNVFVVSDL